MRSTILRYWIIPVVMALAGSLSGLQADAAPPAGVAHWTFDTHG